MQGMTSVYATVTDLVERYTDDVLRHLTDPMGQAVRPDVALRALADAQAELETHVGRRYALPLFDAATGAALPVPTVLVRCCCDVAMYRLQTLRPSDDIKDARQRYEDVLRFLKSLGAGEVELVGARLRQGLADALPTQSAGLPEFGQPASLFGRGHR